MDGRFLLCSYSENLIVLHRLRQWGFLVGLLLAFDAVCADYGFRIIRAEFVPSGQIYTLNADIDYRFSESALEALKHGVPLTLVMRLKIKRHRHYWLDETILSESRRFRILYHPLGRSFQIIPGGNTESASLTALLEAMGRSKVGSRCQAIASSGQSLRREPVGGSI